MLAFQNGDSHTFVRRWVATLILDIAALALRSWSQILQHMHARNMAQCEVFACACCSHQKVISQQTNLILKSSMPTIALGIRCWMHWAQWWYPYCSSSGGVALAIAGWTPSSIYRCCSSKRENSTQQGQSYSYCSINIYCIWETDGLCSTLLFMELYSILPTLIPGWQP